MISLDKSERLSAVAVGEPLVIVREARALILGRDQYGHPSQPALGTLTLRRSIFRFLCRWLAFRFVSEMEVREPLNAALLRTLVFSRPWFHTIDLGNGIVTPGVDRSFEKLAFIGLPDDLSGKSVLDVGAFDGFFSFEAERRGAARVVAADEFCWTRPEDQMTDGQGFDIAHSALQSRVEKLRLPVEDICPESVGGLFDLVLFLGVLYHAQDPMRYLRNVFSVCRDMCIVETHIDGLDQDRPVMVFYPGSTLNEQTSNYWGPNRPCVEGMLREVGFSKVELVSCAGSRMTFHARR